MNCYNVMGIELPWPENPANTYTRHTETFIGFTLLYLKMAVILLVPETKVANVGKLIKFGNLLIRTVMWLVLTTMSVTLILSHTFGADCMTRIAYLLVFQELTISYIVTSRDNTHSLSLSLSLSLSTFWLPAVNPTKM